MNLSADLTDYHGEEPATKMIALALPPKPNGTPGVPGTQISNALALYSVAATIPRFGIPLDSRFLTNSPYTTYGTYTDPIAGISAPPTSNRISSVSFLRACFPPTSAAISPASRRRCRPDRSASRAWTRKSGCRISGRRTS
jgi:hypothetical protein